MPVEQLLLLALFVLAILVPLLYRRVAQDSRDETAGRDPAGGRDRTPVPPPGAMQVPERRPRPRVEPGRDARRTPVAPRGARPPGRSRLGTLQDVRRGIVLMTVLGPCRALEPAPPSPRSPERGTRHEGDR